MATEGVLSPLLNPKQASCTARDPPDIEVGIDEPGWADKLKSQQNQQKNQGVPDSQLGIQFRNVMLSVSCWTHGLW